MANLCAVRNPFLTDKLRQEGIPAAREIHDKIYIINRGYHARKSSGLFCGMAESALAADISANPAA
jgi:hypothetical protein